MSAPKPSRSDQAKNYLRYSGLGFQMMGVIFAGAYGGHWLDGRTGWKIPVFTIVLSLSGIAAAMMMLFRETREKP